MKPQIDPLTIVSRQPCPMLVTSKQGNTDLEDGMLDSFAKLDPGGSIVLVGVCSHRFPVAGLEKLVVEVS